MPRRKYDDEALRARALEGPLPRSPPPYRLPHKLPNPLHMLELVV